MGQYLQKFDQLSFKFYPFLLGAPIVIGDYYDEPLIEHDNLILQRAKKNIKKCYLLSVPYDVSDRLFVSLVLSCYNHFALACVLRPAQNAALRHAVTSIRVPKRSKWVCRESLYSIVTPGHFFRLICSINTGMLLKMYALSKILQTFSDIIFCLYGKTKVLGRDLSINMLNRASKALGFVAEDPWVFLIEDQTYCADTPFDQLKHPIR